MELESGDFSIIYQGISSNFRELKKLVDRIRNGVDKREPHYTELFIFT